MCNCPCRGRCHVNQDTRCIREEPRWTSSLLMRVCLRRLLNRTCSEGSLGACLPRRLAFVCTGTALCGHPDSLSSLDSFSFQLSNELITLCSHRSTVTNGHGHFRFCLYRAGAQVNLRTGIVAPLSGRDGMAELVVRLGRWLSGDTVSSAQPRYEPLFHTLWVVVVVVFFRCLCVTCGCEGI